MTKGAIISTLYMATVIICMSSCVISKPYKKEIVYGSKCEITSVTKIESEKPQLLCFVYDRNDFDEPCVGATVALQGTNIQNMIGVDGKVELEIPIGQNQIIVSFLSCEIVEKRINFEPYTRIEIKVYLGGKDNTMGLPKDYYEKSWKYKRRSLLTII